MNMKIRGLLQNLQWNMIGMVLYNFAIWFMNALILRILGAEMSGVYAIAVSIGNVLFAASLWGMRGYIVADHNESVSYTEYTVVRLLSIFLSFVIFFILNLFFQYKSSQLYILLLYMMFKMIEAMIELTDCFNQQALRMDINAKSMVLRSILFILLFYITLKYTANLYFGFIILNIIGACVLFFYNLKYTKKFYRIDLLRADMNRVIQIARDCFPIMMFELLAAAIVAIPRLFYAEIGSKESLGIYTSIYTLIVFLQLAIQILIVSISPYMAKAYQAKEKKRFLRYLFGLIGGAVGLSLFAMILVKLIGEFTVGVLFGTEVALYTYYLYWGIASGLSLSLTWVFGQVFVILRRNDVTLWLSLVSAIVCFILSKLWIVSEDCNRISMILTVSNLSFLLVSLFLFWILKGEAHD